MNARNIGLVPIVCTPVELTCRAGGRVDGQTLRFGAFEVVPGRGVWFCVRKVLGGRCCCQLPMSYFYAVLNGCFALQRCKLHFFCFGQESHLTGGEYGDGCRLGRRGAICPGSGGWRVVRMRRRAKGKQKENRGWGRMCGRTLRAARRG